MLVEKYCFLSLDFHSWLIVLPWMNASFQDESTESGPDPGAPFDPDIDAQLDSLREKLTEVIRMLIAKFFLFQN